MRRLFISTILMASYSLTALAQDVIYKTDGSVLKGTLIEQNFETGIYKILLAGGSIFVVKEQDIQKLTKEDSQPKENVETQLEQVAQESRNRLNTNTASSFPANSFVSQVLPSTAPLSKPVKSSFYIGTLSHQLSYKYQELITRDYGYNYDYEEVEATENFKGIKFGFQHVHSKHIASSYSLSRGSFDSVEVVTNDGFILESYSKSELPSVNYLGLSASVLASTNLQRGWQFFTGLGLLRDAYSSGFGDFTYTSLALELGMGYSWEKVQLGLQYQGVLAGDYESDLNVRNLYLQLGVNI